MEFSILYQLQGIHSPWLDRLMVVLTFLGDKGWFWIVLGGALSCHRRTRDWGIAVLLSLAAGFLVGNCLLKELVGRSRPCWIDPGVGTWWRSRKIFPFPQGILWQALRRRSASFSTIGGGGWRRGYWRR